MRKITQFAAAGILALGLSGCFWSKEDPRIQEVKDFAVKTCKYLPTAATVADILATGIAPIPGVPVAQVVARMICSAVNHWEAMEAQPKVFGLGEFGQGSDCPMVNGVCIKGKRVNPQSYTDPDK